MPLNKLRFDPPRSADPSRGWVLIVTLALFLLPGTVQRDPWKTEDATYFGIVWRALASGDWTVFRLSSTGLAEPPLYYWLSGLTWKILTPLLTAPAAIRSASIFFVALAALTLFHAARRMYGERLAGAAPLLLIGTLGLLIGSHDVQPMTAVLAALAFLLLGTTRIETPLVGGALMAVGVAGTLLASGLRLAPVLMITLAATLLSRKRGAAAATAIGLTGGSALFASWWMMLHGRSPELALSWFAHQSALLHPDTGAARNFVSEIVTLSWFAWPAWPLATYALWVKRNRLTQDALRIPLAMTLAILLTLAWSGEIRQSWYISLLPPLVLLGTAALDSIRRGGESLLDWFGRMTFGLFLIVVILGWTAMVFGWPEKWAAKSIRWAPGFVGHFDLLAITAAVACITAWIAVCVRLPRSPQKSLFAWSGGLTTFWFVIVALWLPWFDHQRSYRGLAQAVASHVTSDDFCIGAKTLGEAQFALFDYYLEPPLLRRPVGNMPCRFELVQGSPAIEIAPPGEWRRIWEGSRPGDRNERYRLYVRP